MGNSKSKISVKRAERLENETHFTKQEVSQWYKGFMKDCPSGKLLKNEFAAIYGQFYQSGDSTAFANFFFDAIDVNNN